jgi:flagellar biosynthesis chaperone FliJ
MTLLNSIFVCNSKENDKETIATQSKLEDDIRDLKEEMREVKTEIKSIYQLIDMRCEICNNKQLAVQSAIDLKFEVLNSKIDNLVLLINQLRG